MLARCWCNGGSCNNGVNGGGRSSLLRAFNVGSCCIGSRCEILPGERRTVNRGLRRFFWNPLQQQLQTDVSSSSDIVSPWLPTWPDSIEPFAVITSPSRRTAPCAACVITIFFFFFLSPSPPLSLSLFFRVSVIRNRYAANTFARCFRGYITVGTCSREFPLGQAWFTGNGEEVERWWNGGFVGSFSCIDSARWLAVQGNAETGYQPFTVRRHVSPIKRCVSFSQSERSSWILTKFYSTVNYAPIASNCVIVVFKCPKDKSVLYFVAQHSSVW